MYACWEAFLTVQEYDVRDTDAIERAVKHSDTVYNLIGRDWETKYETPFSFADGRNFKFNDVHVTAAQNIAEAVAKYNVSRFIHVSTYNADPNSESQFYASKVGN
jgi:NADH dehydrogenase (ubiquinone) 1 alpha subcomplex subunit 9